MPARLILNADDFALTRGINRAVGELAAAAALTSTTLMASGAAFEDSVSIARRHPQLGVGCHVVLVDGRPVSPPEVVPSLVGPGGTFRPTLQQFVPALMTGQIRPDEILREAVAQIRKLQHAGIAVTHVDTHKHTHIFPTVTRCLVEAAELCGVPAIRNPFEPEWCINLHQGDWKRRTVVRLMASWRQRFISMEPVRNARLRTTDGTVAISVTGKMDSGALARILHALPESGTYELCCHPGYNDADLDLVTTRLREHRDVERSALLQEVPRLMRRQHAPRLIHYGNLV
ncbi:MAG TPA: ChbG/HpnK family deacetylase [Acidobacteriaceae bacterium]|nr:ChbG/HpnK family deacetylase [Acidobacteriaceae bacterium]